MAKKQKTAITVNEKEYFLEDMTEKQKTIVNPSVFFKQRVLHK